MFEIFLDDYKKLIEHMDIPSLIEWRDFLLTDIKKKLKQSESKNTEKWMKGFDSLPKTDLAKLGIEKGIISFTGEKLNTEKLKEDLMKISPWRKGPYNIHGLEIDTEWHSDMKWNRLKKHISSLKNKSVLDVGTGNGYHLWRIYNKGASFVLGIEPFMISVIQFYAIKHFSKDVPIFNLPFSLEEIPENLEAFDTVFSMGVLYHAKSPIDHILKLKQCLKPDGELVLETMIVDNEYGQVLVPAGRYAKMRNVWFIPSSKELVKWLEKCGFKNIQCVDISKTTKKEQRSTKWMQFESLNDFLDSNNKNLTIEGYPAPKRGIFIAKKR